MKKSIKSVALLLALVITLASIPMNVFATETSSKITYGSDMDTNPTLQSYKVYEGVVSDTRYALGDVKYTVYLDKGNATETLDVIMYVINWNDEGVGRIGKDSDVDIVTDLIESEASIETGNRAVVVVLDYGKNELAKAPLLKNSLYLVRKTLKQTEGKITIWSDETHTTTEDISVNKGFNYILPAGYRLMRDIPFMEQDIHMSLGTVAASLASWNTNVAANQDIYYSYHTGDGNCTYDHTTYADVDCIAGAPQEINGIVVNHAKQKAPTVSRPEDMRNPDGTQLNYVMRLDIAYPSGEDVEATPVYIKINAEAERNINSSIKTRTYDTDPVDYQRGDLMDMAFSGCTVSMFDHVFYPHERSTAFGQITNGSYLYNSAKSARAAIRCIRYFAETYGYNGDLIGVGGISKASPAAAVLSMIDNENIIENMTYSYEINGESVETRGLYYEGDLNTDGSVSSGRTVQPYMTYEYGYDGTVEYTGTNHGKIDSDITVAYTAAGYGPRWQCGYVASTDMLLGSQNPITGKTVQTVPMIHSAGYFDEYNVWDYWDELNDRFNQYANNPFLMIPMEDRGHESPNGYDSLRDYDRSEAYMGFMLSYLMPDKFKNKVVYVTPIDGTQDASITSEINIQLLRPAASLDAFSNAVSVKAENGDVMEGTWSTNNSNTSGLYTFTPTSVLWGGEKIVVTVSDSIVKEKVTKTFTTEATFEPLADTYVSANQPNTVFGSTGTLLLNGGITVDGKTHNENIIFISYESAGFKDSESLAVIVPALNDAEVNAEFLIIDNYCVDEETLTYSTMPNLDTNAVSLGEYTLTNGTNIVELKNIGGKIKGRVFTLVIRAKDEVTYSFYNEFEAFGDNEDVNPADANTPIIQHNTEVIEGKTYYYGYRTDEKALVSWTPSTNTKDTRRILFTVRDIENQYRNMTVGFDGKGSIYRVFNSISNSDIEVVDGRVMTNGIDITGKTYRFSTEINSNMGTSSPARQVKLGVISSAGNEFYTIDGDINTNNVITNNSLSTFVSGYYDYTISANHIKADILDGSSVIGYSYPMFGIDNLADQFVYFGFFRTVELKENGKELQVEMRSSEALYPDSTVSVIPINGVTCLADTYVSKAEPNTAYGDSEKLIIRGGADESIVFATYAIPDFGSDSLLTLTLPKGNGIGIEAEIFILDKYMVNASELTYNTMPDLSEAKSLGVFYISNNDKTIALGEIGGIAKSPIFTIAIKTTGDDEIIYSQDLESVTLTNGEDLELSSATNVTVINGENYAYPFLADGVSLNESNSIIQVNGSTGSNYVTADPSDSNNQVIKGLTNKASGTGNIKFYNSLGTSLLTSEDAGRVFRFTMKIKLANSAISGDVSVGFPYGGSKTAPSPNAPVVNIDSSKVNSWQTVTVDYTVPENGTETAQVTNSGKNYIAYPAITLRISDNNTANQYTYYLDDFKTVKLAPQRDFSSSEGDGEHMTLQVSAVHSEEIACLADTYVSKANPDTVYDDSGKLIIGGGEDESIVFATYSVPNLNSGDLISLTIPGGSGKGIEKAEIFVLDNTVNLSELTYNTMPDLSKAKSLGVFNIDKNDTSVELAGIADIVDSSVFTIAIKAIDEVIYSQDLESVTLVNGEDLKLGFAKNVAVIDGQNYAYPFLADGVSPNEANSIIHTNGMAGSSYVIVDPSNSNNQIIKGLTYKGSGTGNIKFFNSLGTSLLTSEDAGRIFRFTMKIKLSNSAISGDVSVGFTYGGSLTTPSPNAPIVNIDSSKVNTWQTVTVDYTVPENGTETAQVTNSGNNYIAYPAFALRISDSDTSNQYTYYLDDLKTVKLAAQKDFSSLEGDGEHMTLTVKKSNIIDNNVIAISATVQSGTSGKIISIIDGENTHVLLSAKDGVLVFGDTVLCDSKGNAFDTESSTFDAVAIYDDTKGTVRFVVNGALAYYNDGENIKATYELEAISGGVSSKAVLSANTRAVKLNHLTSEIIGTQTHATEYNVRIISGVDSIYYSAVGFRIETAEESNEVTGQTVYSSIIGDDRYVYAKDYGYNMVAALEIKEVTGSEKLKITPFLLVGDNYIDGESVFYQTIISNHSVSIIEITQAEFE